jgi:translation initiation factor 3 subunit L
MSAFQNGGAPARAMDDESDVEEEALVADYREQVQYEGMEELEPVTSMSIAQQTDDIQSRLAAAAQPLRLLRSSLPAMTTTAACSTSS